MKVSSELRILDLASEVGEISKLGFLKGIGKQIAPEKWQEELGDALYSLLSLMNELDMDTEKSLNTVLAKYESRIVTGNSIGSGS